MTAGRPSNTRRRPGEQPVFDPNGPSIFTAVQEQLGLRLEATRARVDVRAIERAQFANEN